MSEALLRYFEGVFYIEAAKRKGFQEEKVKFRVKKTMESAKQERRTPAALRGRVTKSNNADRKKDSTNNAAARPINKGMPISYTYLNPTCSKELSKTIKNLPSGKVYSAPDKFNYAILRRGYFSTAWKSVYRFFQSAPERRGDHPSLRTLDSGLVEAQKTGERHSAPGHSTMRRGGRRACVRGARRGRRCARPLRGEKKTRVRSLGAIVV
ncbi:hypothetical protein AAG570_009313 [Ranatra chinensis]|uniref:Uncharacterized protein n=1 Tax=Ranatra chinensis TaxID=642074 RepID=A0ABD0Z1R0_9HEMI